MHPLLKKILDPPLLGDHNASSVTVVTADQLPELFVTLGQDAEHLGKLFRLDFEYM